MSELQPLTPPALDRIVARCLEKDPDERLQSARDLAFDLEGLRTASAVSAPAASPGRSHSGRRRAAQVIAGLSIAAALVAAGFVMASRLRQHQPEPPTFKRLTFQRGSIGAARFAPDGNSVLYSAGWDGNPPEVFETRTDLSTTRSLGLPGGISLYSVSRTGRLALRRRAEPWAWNYGPLAVVNVSGAAPRDVLEDVSCADWSPDGVTLAVVRRFGGEDLLEMPPGHILAKTSGWFADVRISPDGRRVAFTDHSVLFDTRGSVAVVDLAGGKTALTGEFATILGLAWSPNGREIWFSAAPVGDEMSLHAVTPEGRLRSLARFPSSVVLHDVLPDDRVLLATENSQVGIRGRSAVRPAERELGWLDASWPWGLSADGGTLLLNDFGETAGPSYAVYVRGMDGTPPTLLGEGAACALSPDGRWALAIHYGPPHRLHLIPAGPGETLTLPRGPVETYQTADFLPDGRGVVFVGAEPGRPSRTWIQEVPDGAPRAITPEGTVGVRTSPDGRWVAATTQDSTLVLVSLDGGPARPVSKLAFREDICQWSADGRTVFIARGGSRLDAFAIDVQSGDRQLWRTFDVPDPAGVRLMGLVMTRDGRSYAYGYMRILHELYLVTGLE